MYAWVAGKTPITADTMNAFLTMQNHKLIHQGIEITAKTGTGVFENSLSIANRAFSFFMSGTELGSILVEMKKYGQGADLVAELRSGLNPDGSTLGTLVATSFVPKEFIDEKTAFACMPFGLKNLTDKGEYWIVLRQSGDTVNKLVLIGETSQDTNFKAFARNGESGKWEAQNAIHFKAMDYSDSGDLVVAMYGDSAKWLVWAGNDLSQVKRYIPADKTTGHLGIRQVKSFEYFGACPREGRV